MTSLTIEKAEPKFKLFTEWIGYYHKINIREFDCVSNIEFKDGSKLLISEKTFTYISTDEKIAEFNGIGNISEKDFNIFAEGVKLPETHKLRLVTRPDDLTFYIDGQEYPAFTIRYHKKPYEIIKSFENGDFKVTWDAKNGYIFVYKNVSEN